jgi:hypothetical protein
MQNDTKQKAEIIALLEGRTQASLENIRQFILDLDERDYMEFLYPSDPDFVEELEVRNAEAKGMLETLRDIEGRNSSRPGSRQDQSPLTCVSRSTGHHAVSLRRRRFMLRGGGSCPPTCGKGAIRVR